MKLLVLGGSGFLGPQIVAAARKNQHTVTVFHRGKSGKTRWPDVEWISGDRAHDQYGDLAGRTWDAVIDTSANLSSWMRGSTAALQGKTGQYVFTSSISAYPPDSFEQAGKDESAETIPWPEDADESDRDWQLYGAQKARCEHILLDAFQDRATVIRPGLIVGAGDFSDRFTYWPMRVARGGEILAPGTPNDPVQFIDAVDLGAWIVHVCEQGYTGIYNATGPQRPLPIAGLLYACKAAVSNDAHFTWVNAAFLQEHQVGAWMELPLWVPPEGDMFGFSQVSIAKALAHDLAFRPLADTIRDTLAWAQARPADHRWHAGLAAEKEVTVLKAWHDRSRRVSWL